MNNVTSLKYKNAQLGQIRIAEDQENDILLNVWYKTSGTRHGLAAVDSNKMYYHDDVVIVTVVDYDYTVVKRDTGLETDDYYFSSIQSTLFYVLEKISESDLDFLEQCIDGGYDL